MSGAPSPDAGRVVVVGNVGVDVLMAPVPAWPEPGTERLVDRFELRMGGSGGNVAAALAALGTPAELVASVGRDALGGWLEARLAEADVRPEPVNASTALTVGLSHPDGERTFLSHLGHLERFPFARLDAALGAARPGDVLLLCGTFLLPELRPRAADVARRARGAGLRVALDTGWPTEGWTDAVREEVLSLLPHVDLFVPNRDEATALADGGDPCAAAEAFPCATMVKLGAEGAALHDHHGWHRAVAPRVRVVDTVGAGDTFLAALAAGAARGRSWADALPVATAAASLAVGSQPRRYPSWEEASAAATG